MAIYRGLNPRTMNDGTVLYKAVPQTSAVTDPHTRKEKRSKKLTYVGIFNVYPFVLFPYTSAVWPGQLDEELANEKLRYLLGKRERHN